MVASVRWDWRPGCQGHTEPKLQLEPQTSQDFSLSPSGPGLVPTNPAARRTRGETREGHRTSSVLPKSVRDSAWTRPGAPVTTSVALVTTSVLAPSSKARSPSSFLLLLVRHLLLLAGFKDSQSSSWRCFSKPVLKTCRNIKEPFITIPSQKRVWGTTPIDVPCSKHQSFMFWFTLLSTRLTSSGSWNMARWSVGRSTTPRDRFASRGDRSRERWSSPCRASL